MTPTTQYDALEELEETAEEIDGASELVRLLSNRDERLVAEAFYRFENSNTQNPANVMWARRILRLVGVEV